METCFDIKYTTLVYVNDGVQNSDHAFCSGLGLVTFIITVISYLMITAVVSTARGHK